ncbi:hypothetical protein SERLA73DRAFT_149937 [Serpula lacrymans var. lacrymans S7.3]|uniref:Cupin type-1 domain-containing protein n=1 Tax=Serpula lacrymans var. lacrymans (strain S7.3) TaxID=936435 RepID=F8PJB9_SERL3|nr:hypothetical protein SERLA73DRAFT_149937 [Serpula lacrymans var. lacrymans S7.3]
MRSWCIISSTLAFVSAVIAAPASTGVASAPASTPTVPYASDDPNYPLWNETTETTPEPIRGSLGATIIAQQNVELDRQNTDSLAPPTTDNGEVPNFKWPMSLSHNRLATGGWARQQNVNDMPIATELAGVDMRLEAGAIRELHWHSAGEWAYVLKGDLRVSTVTPEGQVYLGDVSAGDLWFFPAGNPHSIQAKNTTAEGAEFLLIFDSGTFSEDNTFLLTDWMAHIPKEVIAKNFQELPPPANIEQDMVVPNDTPLAYTFPFSQVNATQAPGGTYKVADTRTFPAATTICAAEVTVEVGGMRELHWHPTQPEWTYFITGEARITAFASLSNAQTTDFQAGDVAYIPATYGHYIENTGNTTLKFLEIFKSAIFQDISLNQWLALTPPELVKAHLDLDDETISKLSKVKQEVVGPSKSMQ